MRPTQHRFLFVLFLSAALALSACAPVTAPPPEAPEASAAPATVEIPVVQVEVTADGISIAEEIPSGIVAIEVENNGGPEGFPEIARLNDDATVEQLMEALASGDDMAALALVTLHGAPAASIGNQVVYDLEAGNYVAVAFAEDGPPLVQPFAAGDVSGALAPDADVHVELIDFQFVLPDEIKAGVNVWQIENKGEQWHEMAILKLNEGVTMDDLMAMFESMGEEEPDGPPPFEDVAFWSPMNQGESAWVTWDLPVGEYTVICFLPDLAGDGTPHVAHGMVRTLTVTE